MSEKKIIGNVTVEQGSRSEWGSSGGIGYYDQVIVCCGTQKQVQEWQWRDRYSASNDRPSLRIDKIGEVKVVEAAGHTTVTVEIINQRYSNRTATFRFDHPKTEQVIELSGEERAAFSALVEREMTRILADFEQLWEYKVKMVNPHPTSMSDSYVSYRRPSIKERSIHPEIGVAAFVTEEQIDHIVSDAQIRYELFVLKAGEQQAERKAEDHGYDRADGGAFLSIVSVEPDQVIISTKRGKSTIKL